MPARTVSQNPAGSGRLRTTLNASVETLPLKAPFRISGYTFTEVPVLLVTLGDGKASGRGEAAGVYYLDDVPARMLTLVEAHRDGIEAGISREDLRHLLPVGGARNALDCALWEFEAGRAGQPVWKLAGMAPPGPLVTAFTFGADSAADLAEQARARVGARALKLKLSGDVYMDAERVRTVRAVRPDVWLGVDANQGYTPDTLERLLPVLVDARVALLEQPFARGRDADLDGLDCPIPIAADESVQTLDDIEGLQGRCDVVNIKLDKCGGLTEALLMEAEARRLGFDVMVGNMVGSSWAMAPAFLLGQLCDINDLDGPTFLAEDRTPAVRYVQGRIECPEAVWGGGERTGHGGL